MCLRGAGKGAVLCPCSSLWLVVCGFRMYVCVCTYWEYLFNFRPGGTEPQQLHSWEKRNVLGPESHLIWLPLTCTASQRTGDKMDTQMIDPRYTIISCV